MARQSTLGGLKVPQLVTAMASTLTTSGRSLGVASCAYHFVDPSQNPRNLQQDLRFTDPEKTWVSKSSQLDRNLLNRVRWDSVPFNFWWTKTYPSPGTNISPHFEDTFESMMFLKTRLVGDVYPPWNVYSKFASGIPPIFRCYVHAWGTYE